MLKTSTSLNHFVDTNVLLSHANGDSGEAANDINTIIAEAVAKRRRIWISTILFAELRPSRFVPGNFKDLNELARYIQSFAMSVSNDPPTNLRAARLRDKRWLRPLSTRNPNERPRVLTLGDSIHLAAALWVKETLDIPDLEFLTFDNGKSATTEDGPKQMPLPLLRLEDYTNEIGDDPDVMAAVRLSRMRPRLSQLRLASTSSA